MTKPLCTRETLMMTSGWPSLTLVYSLTTLVRTISKTWLKLMPTALVLLLVLVAPPAHLALKAKRSKHQLLIQPMPALLRLTLKMMTSYPNSKLKALLPAPAAAPQALQAPQLKRNKKHQLLIQPMPALAPPLLKLTPKTKTSCRSSTLSPLPQVPVAAPQALQVPQLKRNKRRQLLIQPTPVPVPPPLKSTLKTETSCLSSTLSPLPPVPAAALAALQVPQLKRNKRHQPLIQLMPAKLK